jgi:two-component system, NtrC family, nitrogen regulation response regulator NtrX
LQSFVWPGNARELRNMVERLMLLASSNEIDEETVRAVIVPGAESRSNPGLGSGTLAERVEKFEREAILAELKRAGFHMTNAAKVLGLERSHLYKKAEQLGIDLKKERREEEVD